MTIDLPFVFEPKPGLNPKAYGGLNLLDANNIDRWFEFGFYVKAAAPHGDTIRANYNPPSGVSTMITRMRVGLRRVEAWTSPGEQMNQLRLKQTVNVEHVGVHLQDDFGDVGVQFVDKVDSLILWAFGPGPFRMHFHTYDLATGGRVTYIGSAYFFWYKGIFIPNA